MNLIERYEALVAQRDWEKALHVIQEVIERSPEIDTSWFNYGVCLDELGRHSEAAEAFIKAQEKNIEDWGIHYRIFRSLRLAGDLEVFLEFADYSCSMNKEMIHTLLEDEDFGVLFERDDFQALKEKWIQN